MSETPTEYNAGPPRGISTIAWKSYSPGHRNFNSSGYDAGHYNTGVPEQGWVLYSMRCGCWEQRTQVEMPPEPGARPEFHQGQWWWVAEEKNPLDPSIINGLTEAIHGTFEQKKDIALHIMAFAGAELTDADTEILEWPEISDNTWIAMNQDVRRTMLAGLLLVLSNAGSDTASIIKPSARRSGS